MFGSWKWWQCPACGYVDTLPRVIRHILWRDAAEKKAIRSSREG